MVQGARMFSDNIQLNQQFGWQCNDKTPAESHLIVGNQSPYAARANENSLTHNVHVQIINEKDRNSVSFCSSKGLMNLF